MCAKCSTHGKYFLNVSTHTSPNVLCYERGLSFIYLKAFYNWTNKSTLYVETGGLALAICVSFPHKLGHFLNLKKKSQVGFRMKTGKWVLIWTSHETPTQALRCSCWVRWPRSRILRLQWEPGFVILTGPSTPGLKARAAPTLCRARRLLPRLSAQALLKPRLAIPGRISAADVAGDAGSPASGYIKEASLWESGEGEPSSATDVRRDISPLLVMIV